MSDTYFLFFYIFIDFCAILYYNKDMKKEVKTESVIVKAVHLEGLGVLYPVESVMKILGVSLPTLKKYEKNGAIKIVKFGKSYITAQSLGLYFNIETPNNLFQEGDIRTDVKQLKQAGEKDKIETALQSVGGNVSRAAQRLQISRDTLYRKMKTLDIETKQAMKGDKAPQKKTTPVLAKTEEIPFFLNIKELMTYLRRRWRNKEQAEVKYIFPENPMYKEFQFEMFTVKKREGRKILKRRWYNWNLITQGNKIEAAKEPEYELHAAVAGLIGKLQTWFKIQIYQGDRVLYYDTQKKRFIPVTIDSTNDLCAFIKLDGEIKEVETGYFLPLGQRPFLNL